MFNILSAGISDCVYDGHHFNLCIWLAVLFIIIYQLIKICMPIIIITSLFAQSRHLKINENKNTIKIIEHSKTKITLKHTYILI